MSRWTHPICEQCYTDRDPEREPVRIKQQYREEETCYFCGKKNKDGIYYRADPDDVAKHCVGHD